MANFTAKIDFSSIKGSVGKYSNHGLIFYLKVPINEVNNLRRRLTVINNSLFFRMKQIMNTINGLNAKIKQSNSRQYTERLQYVIGNLLQEYKELQSNQKKEYFEQINEDTFKLPPGLWYLADRIEGDGHLNKNIPVSWFDERLRPYQREAVLELLKYKRATGVLATGLGKSLIISTICKNFELAGKRICVVVPTEELVKQMSQSIGTFCDTTAAGGGKKPKLGTNVLVTTAASAIKYIDVYDVVLIDECLTHNQKISTNEGPIPIGVLYKKWKSGQQLPLVLSFNEKTKNFEYKKITYAWKNTKQKRILQIKSSRIKVICTEDHLVFTQNKGWVCAKNLEEGDLLIGPYKKEIKQDMGSKILTEDQRDFLIGSYLGDGHFYKVSKNRYKVQFIYGEKQKEYIEWKKNLIGVSNIRKIKKRGCAQKSVYQFFSNCFNIVEEFPSNKKFIPDWIINSLNFKSLAVWIMDSGSVDHNKKTIVISTCSFDLESYEKIQQKMLELGIEAKIKEYYGCLYIVIGKDGYNFIMNNIYKYIPDCMKYKLISSKRHLSKHQWQSNKEVNICTFPISKIKEIEYIKKKKTGFGLYDLEIEDNHNFVTASGKGGGGVLVHNCHHSSALTWENLLLAAVKAEYVYNLTATPFRADGMDLGIHAFGGPTVFYKDTKWGVDNGWLAKPEIFFVNIIPKDKNQIPIEIPQTKNVYYAYKVLTERPEVINFIVRNVNKAIEQNKKCLILYKTVKAGQHLAKILKANGIECGFASSNTKKVIKDFKENKIRVMISNDRLVGEGVDIPDADILFNIIQNSSNTTTFQVAGRVLRLSEGKTKGTIIDLCIHGYDQFVNSGKKRMFVYQKICNDVKIVGKKS